MRVVKSLFTPPPEECKVSIDRLNSSNCVFLTQHHDDNAKKRPDPSHFQGWLVSLASNFRSAGWTLAARPVNPENPYHAEVKPHLTRTGIVDVLRDSCDWQERCD